MTFTYEAEHVNTEAEIIGIARAGSSQFGGQPILIIEDDPPLRLQAPMLLDAGTRAWLRTQIDRLDDEENAE